MICRINHSGDTMTGYEKSKYDVTDVWLKKLSDIVFKLFSNCFHIGCADMQLCPHSWIFFYMLQVGLNQVRPSCLAISPDTESMRSETTATTAITKGNLPCGAWEASDPPIRTIIPATNTALQLPSCSIRQHMLPRRSSSAWCQWEKMGPSLSCPLAS